MMIHVVMQNDMHLGAYYEAEVAEKERLRAEEAWNVEHSLDGVRFWVQPVQLRGSDDAYWRDKLRHLCEITTDISRCVDAPEVAGNILKELATDTQSDEQALVVPVIHEFLSRLKRMFGKHGELDSGIVAFEVQQLIARSVRHMRDRQYLAPLSHKEMDRFIARLRAGKVHIGEGARVLLREAFAELFHGRGK